MPTPGRQAAFRSSMTVVVNSVCGKGRGELLDGLLDPGIQRERRNRQLARTLHVGQRDGAGLELGIEHRTAPHFLPVVILGVDPEDRDHWDAVDVRR